MTYIPGYLPCAVCENPCGWPMYDAQGNATIALCTQHETSYSLAYIADRSVAQRIPQWVEEQRAAIG